jgi:alkylhydroperoxidase/carboxymuconolactone decarboxylase family protein YurZ
MTRKLPPPPGAYTDFITRFPKLGEAWEAIHAAGSEGPLDDRTQRLIKLAVAIGAQRQGAVHSSVRKALAQGIPMEQLEQVVALAAGTLGLPATVAAHTWLHDKSK